LLQLFLQLFSGGNAPPTWLKPVNCFTNGQKKGCFADNIFLARLQKRTSCLDSVMVLSRFVKFFLKISGLFAKSTDVLGEISSYFGNFMPTFPENIGCFLKIAPTNC
jgi:hypothetical protein